MLFNALVTFHVLCRIHERIVMVIIFKYLCIISEGISSDTHLETIV